MSKPEAVDEKTFDTVVGAAKTPVLVDFWATWCSPCRMIAPIVDELSDEYAGRVGFAKVNVDENRKLSERFEIRSIPTLIVFKDGKPAKQIVGLRSKGDLKKALDEALSAKK